MASGTVKRPFECMPNVSPVYINPAGTKKNGSVSLIWFIYKKKKQISDEKGFGVEFSWILLDQQYCIAL